VTSYKNISNHAQQRLKQRGIPELMLNLLVQYGRDEYQKGGTTVWRLSRKAAKRLRQDLKEVLGRLDALADTYFVEATDGTVITAGHQTH
jgi:hypothetical protein